MDEIFESPDREFIVSEAMTRQLARRMGHSQPHGFMTQAVAMKTEWQKQVLNLPVFPEANPFGQNNDGTFVFTLGIDTIGTTPIG